MLLYAIILILSEPCIVYTSLSRIPTLTTSDTFHVRGSKFSVCAFTSHLINWNRINVQCSVFSISKLLTKFSCPLNFTFTSLDRH